MEEGEFVSAIPYPYLDACCSYVSRLAINWSSYFERGLISADEMSVLTDLQDHERWTELLNKDAKLYVALTFEALRSLTDREVLIAIMVHIERMLSDQHYDQVIGVLSNSLDLLSVLERSLRSSDEYVSIESARLLCIASRSNDRRLEFSCCTIGMMDWAYSGLRAHGEKEICCDAATFFLQYLLELKQFRAVFVDNQEAVLLLLDIAKTRAIQLQYQAVLCLWILSFDRHVAARLQSRYEVIPLLLDICRTAVKDKIVRVCLAIWANLLIKARRIAVPVMIGCKVLDFVESLLSRKIADEELLADATYVKEELAKAFLSLNSFDEYASEIKSGNLHWSPPHKSAIFWSDNAAKLEESDGELLRVLTRLLTHSQDPTVLAVAANDLGEYISRRPQGRKFIEALGTKQQLMHLMAHQNSDVRFSALNSVQKYMANLWYQTFHPLIKLTSFTCRSV